MSRSGRCPLASESVPTENPLTKRPVVRSGLAKRTHSASPTAGTGGGTYRVRQRSPVPDKKRADRRCLSSSPTNRGQKKLSKERPSVESAPEGSIDPLCSQDGSCTSTKMLSKVSINISEPEPHIPHVLMTKTMRLIATKKREFMKIRKNLIMAQNMLIESYAGLKEMEAKIGVPQSDDASIGEVRLVSVSSWPAHDLLMLLRDKPSLRDPDMHNLGSQVISQLHAHLDPIPEEVLNMAAELMARRIDMLNLLRGKYKVDRLYASNLEWKNKYADFDAETERLHRMVAGTAENLKSKLNHSLSLTKTSWLDREYLIKKIERLQKENLILQNRVEELKPDPNQMPLNCNDGTIINNQLVSEELAKEKAAREALKDVVSAAESMLRVARARIATLERQLKEANKDLETTRKKHKDLEQLYRNRESNFDARSKKLMENSKIGEVTIESLSRQRSALELRVKELREQTENNEKLAETRSQDQKARIESLTMKMADQEKLKKAAEIRVLELETKVKELEEALNNLRERSVRLVDLERRRCLEYIPSKESEPSDRETEIWKELQVTRMALAKAEEEVRNARIEKDSFLSSLTRIAQGEDPENYKDKMATELLDKEQKISKLQHSLDEQRENEKQMEQSMAQYENQLASLRLEVRRLRNYDCYVKDEPFQDLQTEIIELQLQVETLSRERTALVTAAASRALMLERHERAADLFAKMTSARRDLAAVIDGRTDPPPLDSNENSEIPRSLSVMCTNATDTWMALRAERARVLRLEGAILTQRVQLERESRVRTQLERRRAMLEREVLRIQHSNTSESSVNTFSTTSPRVRTFLGMNERSERNIFI